MDLNSLFSLCGQAVNAGFAWFEQFAFSVPALGQAVLSVFTIYTAWRLLLRPLLGYAGSDLVDKGGVVGGFFKQRKADRAYARSQRAKANHRK